MALTNLSCRPATRRRQAWERGDQFVVVVRRVQKLGPCGTVILDHDTGEEKVVTKRYRVREEELQSIDGYSLDGDGDSVMGSDDFVIPSSRSFMMMNFFCFCYVKRTTRI